MKKLILMLLPFLAACTAKPDLNDLIKSMVVQTNYDETINFSAYSTFFMPDDTLGLVSNALNDTLIVNNYARTTVQRIKSEMTSAGYTFSPIDGDPDLAVNAYIVDNQGVYQTINYPYSYYGYPGYYYGGYYGYGGFYGYPSVQSFSYQSGIMVIEIVDLKNPTIDNKLRVVWVAKLGDAYEASDQLQNMLSAISQAFKQSPYLTR
jgi:hypothetical protein